MATTIKTKSSNVAGKVLTRPLFNRPSWPSTSRIRSSTAKTLTGLSLRLAKMRLSTLAIRPQLTKARSPIAQVLMLVPLADGTNAGLWHLR